jgi:hypothetical protein
MVLLQMFLHFFRIVTLHANIFEIMNKAVPVRAYGGNLGKSPLILKLHARW